MKVSIFTEGGKKFGYGHVVRCLAIAEALNELGCVVDFFINGEIDVKNLMPNFKCYLGPWVENPNKDFSDFVIFDSYHASMNQMQHISGGRKVLFIDDYQRFEYPQDSWILNACPGISSEIYPKNNNVLLGTRYLPLRKEFWDISSVYKRKFNDIEKILVMFGGSDMRRLVPPTVRILLEEFKDIEIVTIQGRSSYSRSETKKLATTHKRIKVYEEPTTSEIFNHILESDIGVAAAGQTLQELACLGLPTIAVKVAENQDDNIRGWSDSSVIIPIMSYNSNNYNDKLTNALKALATPRARYVRSNRAMQLIDGQGARRIAKCIMQNI